MTSIMHGGQKDLNYEYKTLMLNIEMNVNVNSETREYYIVIIMDGEFNNCYNCVTAFKKVNMVLSAFA